jgi:DNA-binding transcriptional MerR regulator
MAREYRIADLRHLLRVESHTIRYWEQMIPLLRPRKSPSGRRIYGDREVQLFLRLKHLLYERHFTLEGAKDQLYRELNGDYLDIRAEISALRSGLLDIYFMLSR